MLRELNIRGIRWIDWSNLDKKDIYEVIKDYDFHELDMEACMEENQRARIDSYENYLFIILHFPKYDKKTKTYKLNEFNVFLWKDFLITFSDFWTEHLNKLFDKYLKLDIDLDDQHLKITTWFILYELVQSMLEKMFKLLDNVWKDIRLLEKSVFGELSAPLIKDIMMKKRNTVLLKHMFKPQVSVLKLLEFNINKLYKWQMEVYFEDLEDKLEYIVNDIYMLEEDIASIEDAFKSIIDMRTNSVIKVLTILSTFLLPLTLITSFYGMNVKLPYRENPYFVYSLLVFVWVFMLLFFYFFKKKRKF